MAKYGIKLPMKLEEAYALFLEENPSSTVSYEDFLKTMRSQYTVEQYKTKGAKSLHITKEINT
jgi:hypothetical protein